MEYPKLERIEDDKKRREINSEFFQIVREEIYEDPDSGIDAPVLVEDYDDEGSTTEQNFGGAVLVTMERPNVRVTTIYNPDLGDASLTVARYTDGSYRKTYTEKIDGQTRYSFPE